MIEHRRPYVGEGPEGCLRSANIDRSEADGFDRDDPRRAAALESAARWEAQARDLVDAMAAGKSAGGRPPIPRHTAAITITLVVGAVDDAQARERVELAALRARDAVNRRLAGMPTVVDVAMSPPRKA